MTLNEFAQILNSTNLPVRYGFFRDADKPVEAYIEYECSYTENFGAENKVYKVIQHIDIFLFTKIKDPTSEAAVEAVFDQNDIYWNKTETYLSDEKAYQILYEVTIYG